MRQVGTLPTENLARRFAAWLIAQRIEAHAEQEDASWVVWVRDEDQLTKAREAFTHFRDHPDDAKYQGAEKSAEARLREDEARRRQAQGNVVEMRGRWGSGMPGAGGVRRRAPLVTMLIVISVVVALLTWPDTMEEQRTNPEFGSMYRALLFVDPYVAQPLLEDGSLGPLDMWASIRRGEVWRLVTPIFIHYGLMHIVFNMMLLYSFGSQIEDRRGTRFLLLLVLAVAVLSDIGQATEGTILGIGTRFGGISGVVYGLFGYLFVKIRFDNREGYFLGPSTTIMAIGWLLLCVLAQMPGFSGFLSGLSNVANTAHVVGLLSGAAIAYVPLLIRKPA